MFIIYSTLSDVWLFWQGFLLIINILNYIKMTKQDLQEQVYEPIRELKQKFYDSKTQDEWNACKEELVELLATAESVMDADFYPKYKEGVLTSIKKMYDFKQKYFAKQQNGEKKTYTPKTTYLLQDDLAVALTKYIELQTKLLELQLKNIFQENPQN